MNDLNSTRLFKDHGIGVGLRAPHYSHFTGSKPKSVNWVEVISENFMPWKGQAPFRPFHKLMQVRQNIPVALHGVSLSIGSADDLNMDYLKALKDLADKVEPMWMSDHLCFTGVNNENLYDLLPLPYTQDVISHVVDKIQRVQDFLGQRFIIENLSSYVSFEESEMLEWTFIDEIAKRTDCGLLLDINNIYVSGINHDFDPKTYIDSMPTDQIAQIHLAGHTVRDGYLIDTHDEPVSREVWQLYRYALEKHGLVSSMIERDSNIPDWEDFESELKTAHNIYKSAASTLAKTGLPDSETPREI